MAMKALSRLLIFVSVTTGYMLPEKGNGPITSGHILPKRGMILYKSGEYTLANMNLDQVTLMRSLLENLWSALLPVIQDAQAPSPSIAYTTFFKDPTNMPYVASLLSNITAGASVNPPTSPPPFWAPFSPNGSPVFYAVTAPNQISVIIDGAMIDVFDRCNNQVGFTAAYFSQSPPVPFVVLCPLFFNGQPPYIFGDLPPSPAGGQPASNCLSVNTAINRYRYNGPRTDMNPLGFGLTQYRMWILLEELVHHYTWVSLNSTMDTYDINKCLRLSSQDSLGSAHTYVYYAASIFASCRDFPVDNRRKNELLEVDADDPSDDGDDTPLAFAGPLSVTGIQVATNNTIVSTQ